MIYFKGRCSLQHTDMSHKVDFFLKIERVFLLLSKFCMRDAEGEEKLIKMREFLKEN